MPIIELNEDERNLVGFALACYLEDLEKRLNKLRKQGSDTTLAVKQMQQIEKVAYTKIIPESWNGPKPTYWRD